MYWLKVAGLWLALCGVIGASLVLVMGLPVLQSLVAVAVLVTGLFWHWNRELPAPEMVLRESLWNTPEDDDLTDDLPKDNDQLLTKD